MATTHAGYPHHPVSFKGPSSYSSASASVNAQTAARKSTSNSAGGSSTEAPWYGHKEIAVICGQFVCDTFGSPDLLSTDPSRHGPNPPIAHFVAYALYRTRLPQSVTFCALHLLHRLKERFPAAKGSSGHRLFICSFMIASKVVCDDTYSNKSWCVVGQNLFALKEMNQMEREMCGYLDWQLNADPSELEAFERDLRSRFGLRVPVTSTSDSSRWSRPTPAPLVIPSKSYPNPHSAVLTPPPSPTPALSSPLTPFSEGTSSGAPSPASSEETCLTPPSEHEPHVAVHDHHHSRSHSRMSIHNLTSPEDISPYDNFYASTHAVAVSSHKHVASGPPKTIAPVRSSSEPTIMPSSRGASEKIECKGGFALATPATW